ncbi:coiled-coil domain-containing protein 97 [Planococcus citri]|uniref:coiled-coil domain-containing protein 97 n=1 Tax=Planococcus citri TaxID=170843 RepID=UPI0031F9D809
MEVDTDIAENQNTDGTDKNAVSPENVTEKEESTDMPCETAPEKEESIEMSCTGDSNTPLQVNNSTDSKVSNSADEIRNQMLDYLANKTNVHFKSQQIGEPDLSFSEKRSIAENVLNQSHSTFLSRFGDNLLMEHLSCFNDPGDESYEVQYYLNKLKSCKCKPLSEVQIKNRRFEAMKRLMSEGEYFSVGEMRKRNPLLFDQLLGGFLTDPESKTDPSQEHAFAHILLDQIEQDQVAALKKKQLEAELEQSKECPDSSDDEECTKMESESSTSKEFKDNLILWGKSYKNNHTIGKTRWKSKHSSSTKPKNFQNKCKLSHEEKVLLINEFTSSMFHSFLHGKDEFDYNEVDNNPEYDDEKQCDVDEEEKYFDSESPEERSQKYSQEVEDDELDDYMKNIEGEVSSDNLASSFQRMNADNDNLPKE